MLVNAAAQRAQALQAATCDRNWARHATVQEASHRTGGPQCMDCATATLQNGAVQNKQQASSLGIQKRRPAL